MSKSKFTQEQLDNIEKIVNENSIPYDYKSKDYSLEMIIQKYGDSDEENVSLYVPDYQREFVWKRDRQSRFIESVLLGVPLTPFLVSEDEYGKLEIIDGSQRIRTLISFCRDFDLRLSKLETLPLINGAKFDDLPRRTQGAMKNRDFKIIVVNNKANLKVRQDIFDRINTSSEPLTDSEIRKGAYSGAFYNLVNQLSKEPLLLDVCPISPDKTKRGEYNELILRFFAYAERYKQFKHDVAIFLNDFLEDKNETDFDSDVYKNDFTEMLSFVKQYFPIGFRRDASSNSTPRVRFEAIAVGVHLALKENSSVIPEYMDWLSSQEFFQHTTSDASNNKYKLQGRVEFVRDCILNKIKKDELNYAKR